MMMWVTGEFDENVERGWVNAHIWEFLGEGKVVGIQESLPRHLDLLYNTQT